MTMRSIASLVILLALSPSFREAYPQDQNNGIKAKSYHNWFAKDMTKTPGRVTTQDLLNSPKNGEWLLYHGDYGANRFSSLDQINLNNANKLVPKWIYQIGRGEFNLRSSPIVYKGIMYVTGSDEVHALDAATGTWLWVWQARYEDSSHINRGVAIYGDRLFFATGDCLLVALDRMSGNVIWSKQFAKPSDNYFSTTAPLVVGDKVILGISNKNSGSRGFIAAFSTVNGSELWRFWTIPEDVKFRGAPTWMLGSYDPLSDVLYWPVGVLEDSSINSSGLKNIHDNSVVALNPQNGKVIWETELAESMPFDWDANEPLVLTDVVLDNVKRKVILLAHRNGLFYLIDRVDGKIIFSKPFIEKLDWLSKNTCPSSWGATNWMSPSFSSVTNLFYVMVLEGCRSDPNTYHIKAIEPTSGNIVWDYPTRGKNLAAPGILSTEGGIVFSGEGSGHVVVLNAKSGKKVWDFNVGKPIFASPVTYLSQNQQLISMVAGSDIITFGLY